MKDLPKIYQNSINKKIDNNDSIYYSRNSNDNSIQSKKNVLQKINDIFSSNNYVYKANVNITLKDKTISKKIIGRNKDYIITMDNNLIPIKDIIDINSSKK